MARNYKRKPRQLSALARLREQLKLAKLNSAPDAKIQKMEAEIKTLEERTK